MPAPRGITAKNAARAVIVTGRTRVAAAMETCGVRLTSLGGSVAESSPPRNPDAGFTREFDNGTAARGLPK